MQADTGRSAPRQRWIVASRPEVDAAEAEVHGARLRRHLREAGQLGSGAVAGRRAQVGDAGAGAGEVRHRRVGRQSLHDVGEVGLRRAVARPRLAAGSEARRERVAEHGDAAGGGGARHARSHDGCARAHERAAALRARGDALQRPAGVVEGQHVGRARRGVDRRAVGAPLDVRRRVPAGRRARQGRAQLAVAHELGRGGVAARGVVAQQHGGRHAQPTPAELGDAAADGGARGVGDRAGERSPGPGRWVSPAGRTSRRRARGGRPAASRRRRPRRRRRRGRGSDRRRRRRRPASGARSAPARSAARHPPTLAASVAAVTAVVPRPSGQSAAPRERSAVARTSSPFSSPEACADAGATRSTRAPRTRRRQGRRRIALA